MACINAIEIEEIEEINPSNYVYYVFSNPNKLKEFDINEYVCPETKQMVEKFLQNLFSTKKQGPLSNKIANSTLNKKFTGRNKLLVDDKSNPVLKGTLNKSIQTENIIDIHKREEEKSVKTANTGFNTTNKLNKDVISIRSKYVHNGLNYLQGSKNNLLISGKRGQTINSVRSVNGPEAKRKKLHVTKIGGDKKNINNNKGGSLYSNSKCCSEMRYFNIKCNTKLQHIPINLHSLHGKTQVTKHVKRDSFYSSTTAIANVCRPNSFSNSVINSNGNIHIPKTPSTFNKLPSTSKRIQLQELKTYSRKCNENNSCYLLSAIGPRTACVEQKHSINQMTFNADKLQEEDEPEKNRTVCPVEPNKTKNFSTSPLATKNLQLNTIKCRVSTTNASNHVANTNNYTGITVTNGPYYKVTTPKNNIAEKMNIKFLSTSNTINNFGDNQSNDLMECSTILHNTDQESQVKSCNNMLMS